ncbi:MAG: efflux RND transporter periplasmic adaptor subunit [Bacteroidales bacterium]
MNKRVRWSIIGIIFLFVGVMAFYPKLKKNELESTPVQADQSKKGAGRSQKALPVAAEILRPGPLGESIVSTGSVIPDEEVFLTFESSGKVVDIFFQEGSFVKKGTLLAKMNDKPLQAQLKKLEAQLPLLEGRVYRQKTLLAKDAVSQEAYQQVTTDLEKLHADIELVKANIAQTEIRAPFDGIIGLRAISEGAYASTGTSLARLTKVKPLKIEFSFPERYSKAIRKNAEVTFRVDGILEPLKAKVYAVESLVDRKTRTLTARALYANERELLVPGRFASVNISLGEIKDALTIPSEALIPEMGKDLVYVYKNGKSEPVEVNAGLRTESRVQILQGLTVGDTVITTGVMQLRKGMPVAIERIQ